MVVIMSFSFLAGHGYGLVVVIPGVILAIVACVAIAAAICVVCQCYGSKNSMNVQSGEYHIATSIILCSMNYGLWIMDSVLYDYIPWCLICEYNESNM